MKSKTILLFILAAFYLPGCQSGSGPATERQCTDIISDSSTVVSTTYGKIQGYRDGTTYTFKGIPYAKAERFMPPTAPDIHEDILMCRVYGPKAPQTTTSLDYHRGLSDYDFGFQFNLEPVDEKECLVLNVWTGSINSNTKKPVLVWIHGGGFASGSGNDLPCYEGKALSEEGDIVVVNLNHRLNVLGYADLRCLGEKYGNSFNLGMQDIVKALEWVRDNIGNFGGDPSNVTIAGQSGGGGKVSTLLSMPSAAGLFQKAITQSGSWVLHNSDTDGKALGKAFLDELGITKANSSKLNDFSYKEIASAGKRACDRLRIPNGFCPTVDGEMIVKDDFSESAPAISKDVSMIIGSNKEEFSYNVRQKMTKEEVISRLTKGIGKEKAEEYYNTFMSVYPDASPEDVINTDSFLREAAIKMADLKSASGSKVYMYLMTWRPETNSLGACHGMELPLIFRNVSLQREMTGGTESAYRISEIMSSAWISFIKTGNPNTDALPEWEPYTKENGNTMIFDDKCTVTHNHDRQIQGFNIPRHF